MSFPFAQQRPGQLPRIPFTRRVKSRLKRKDKRRFAALERAARQLMLDPLEQRVLLNGDVLALDLSAYYQDNRDTDLLVQLHEEIEGEGETATEVQRVQIIDRSGGTVLSFGDLAEISGVSITGGAGSDVITLDGLSFGDQTPLSFSFDGGEGLDGLAFETANDVEWTIGAPDAGVATDGFVSLSFDNVETLTGAANNNDTFTLDASGALSGGIDGGDGGFDTLVIDGQRESVTYLPEDPNSGSFLIDGTELRFSGLEPVYLTNTASTITIDMQTLLPGTQSASLDLDPGGFDFVIDGPGLESLSFDAPTDSLSIVSEFGLLNPDVALSIDGWDSTATEGMNFSVQTESITLASGVSLGTALNPLGDVTLEASNAASGVGLTLLQLTGIGSVSASLDVQGDIHSSGTVALSAHAERVLDATGDFSDFNFSEGNPLQMPTVSATANVAGTSEITADAFRLEASTLLDVEIDGSQSVLGSFANAVIADVTTHATIQSGAEINVGSTTLQGESVSGLVRASDSSSLILDVTPDEDGTEGADATGIINSMLDDFEVSIGIMTVTRDTQAIVDGTITSGNAFAIEAMNEGSFENKVQASLIGATYLYASDTVLAQLTGDFTGTSLSVSAGNSSSYDVTAKISVNTISGSTRALVEGGTISLAGALNVSALDTSSLTSMSNDFDAYLDELTAIDLSEQSNADIKVAAAISEMDKTVEAAIDGASVSATGNVTVEAENAQTLVSHAEALSVRDTRNTPSKASLVASSKTVAFGGTLAFNEMRGETIAAIRNGADVSGDTIAVGATNAAILDTFSEASTKVTSGNNSAVGVSISFNLIGFDIDVLDAFALGIDTLIGINQYLGNEDPSNAHAYVSASDVAAAGALSVSARNESLIDATVTNSATSQASDSATANPLYDAQGMGFALILANNKIASDAVAEIVDAPADGAITAGGALDVTAEDTTTLASNAKVTSSSVTTNDGGLSGVDAALGTLLPATYSTNGAEVVDSSGAQVAGPTWAVSFGDRVGLDYDWLAFNDANGQAGTVYEYMGDGTDQIDLLDTDFEDTDFWMRVPETELIPTGTNLSDSDSVGVGGMAVRNTFDAQAVARISNADVESVGDMTVKAVEMASLTSTGDVGVSSSGGGSVQGDKGDSVAVGALIVVNTANASALATVEQSADVTSTGGRVTVQADNIASLDAQLDAAISSAGDSVGVLIAFNTLGYEAENILFQTVDALIGTDIGDKSFSDAEARIIDSDVAGQAGVTVIATNSAELTARIGTDVSSDPSAFQGAEAMAAQGVLASNMLAGAANAFIDDTEATPSGESVTSAAGMVRVAASDEVVLESQTLIDTGASRTNDLGLGLLNNLAQELLDTYQYTTESGSPALVFGDRVFIGTNHANSDLHGKRFQYMGSGASVPLATADYTDIDLWKELDETNVIPPALIGVAAKGAGIKTGSAKAYYVMVSRNEAEGGANAFIDDYDVTGASVSVEARERATMKAVDGSTINATETYGGLMVTNELNSRASARITESNVTASAGDVSVEALNLAVLDATTLSSMTGASDAINVVVAFNSVGFDGSNVLFQTIDAILGSDYLIEAEPVGAQAYIEDAVVSATGDVSVTAETSAELTDIAFTDTTAQLLDDMADEKLLDDEDEAGDAAALENLQAEFEAADIAFEGSLSVETVETQFRWYVSDDVGRTWIIENREGTLVLLEANLLDARVGNETSAIAKNNRALFDAYVEGSKEDNKGKGIKDLKYGANGTAGGGLLATNRIASDTAAWISNSTTTSHDDADTPETLSTGETVSVGAEVYEYVGETQSADQSFLYSSRSDVQLLEAGDRIRIHEDHGAWSEGDIVVYSGPTLASTETDPREPGYDPIVLFDVIDGQPGDFTLGNAPLSIDLSDLAQDYANNADWQQKDDTLPEGSVAAGGEITVSASDNAHIRADSNIEVSAVVSNNMDAFTALANQALQNEYVYTSFSGTQTLIEGNVIYIGSNGGAEAGKYYQYSGPIQSYDLADIPALDLGNEDNWTVLNGNVEPQDIFPNVGNLAESNSRAVGGIVVTNDVRSEARATVDSIDLTTTSGDITVSSEADATMLARLTSNVTSSGGSAWGTGESLAVNATIATNMVRASATTLVRDSVLDAGSAIDILADNRAVLDATTQTETNTGDTGVGVTLAFNTLGWEASNLLFNAVDALVGDPLISEALDGEDPSMARALVIDSDLTAGTDLTVEALSTEKLNATVSNSTVSEASAQTDASGKSVGVVLASNKVSGRAYAAIDNEDAPALTEISAGGTVTVRAQDDIGLWSNSKLVSSSTTTNDGGQAVAAETLNDLQQADWLALSGAGLQEVTVKFGEMVRLDDGYSGGGVAGGVYEYLGTESIIDINSVNYEDKNLWKPTQTTQGIPSFGNVSESDSVGVGTLVVLNDLRSDVEAVIRGATVGSDDGDIVVEAIENATMEANVDASTSSSGGSNLGEGTSIAFNGVIATNVLQGGADAAVLDSALTAGDTGSGLGNVRVEAMNTANLTAENLAMVGSGDTGVGVLLAFNSVGWEPSNVLFNTLDGILGDPLISSAFNGEAPVDAEAYILNSSVSAAGKVEVLSSNDAKIIATTSNEATSAAAALENASGTAVGAIVATNKVSGAAKAYIDVANLRAADGAQRVETGDRVIALDGTVYEYSGPEAVIDLASESFGATLWTDVGDDSGYANDIDAGSGVRVEATDNNLIDVTNTLEVTTTVTNDAGLGIIFTSLENVVNEYQYTTRSGVQRGVTFGDMVYIADDYDANKAEPEALYIYFGADQTGTDVDLSTLDYDAEADWVKIDPLDIESLLPPGINLNFSESDATAGGGMAAMNDVRGGVIARVDEATVDTATGDIAIIATENAGIEAHNIGDVSADGGSAFGEGGTTLAVNALIATNVVLSTAEASLEDSDVDSALGAVTVEAANTAFIDSDIDMTTVAEGGGESYGIGVT
ncbi:LEPR-XLL domain-containing protein, partial [bacterium]|nr:LEPR-XLL domain-containing protein [bacterium]